MPAPAPTLLHKAVSYGSAIALAAIVGAGGGFFLYTRLATRRRTPEQLAAFAHDRAPFYECVLGGAAFAVLFVVVALLRADPPKRGER